MLRLQQNKKTHNLPNYQQIPPLDEGKTFMYGLQFIKHILSHSEFLN